MALLILGLLLSALAFAPAAGAQAPIPPPWGEELTDLNAAEQRWATQEPAVYTYSYTTNCYCDPTEVTVAMSGKTVISATDADGIAVADPLTIHDMFSSVRQAIARPADSLTAAYDPVTGHPTEFLIDGVHAPVDGHFGVSVTDFEADPICCDPSPVVDIEVQVSCLNNDGRVDLELTSQHPADGPIAFDLRVGTVSRTVTLISGATHTETVTGRPDGELLITIIERFLIDTTNDFAYAYVGCDPEAPEVVIEQSCLAENGRIDITITPAPYVIAIFPPPPPDLYTVTVGSLQPREVELSGGDPAHRFSVTGRADGNLQVLVEKNGDLLETQTLRVACDPQLVEPFTVRASCLAGNGRIDVIIAIPVIASPPERVFAEVTVGSVPTRTVEITGDATLNRVTVTGRPDGLLDVDIVIGPDTVHSETVTVACDV